MNSKLTLTEDKPFNSGLERFKHYSASKGNQFAIEEEETEDVQVPSESGMEMTKGGDKKVKRLVMTMIKVRVPFGISSNKYEDKMALTDGPDYYDKPK